jgi:hypothetical protein
VGPDRLRRIAAVAMLINPFSVFHVLIDLVIVPICVVLLRRKKGLPRGCSA